MRHFEDDKDLQTVPKDKLQSKERIVDLQGARNGEEKNILITLAIDTLHEAIGSILSTCANARQVWK